MSSQLLLLELRFCRDAHPPKGAAMWSNGAIIRLASQLPHSVKYGDPQNATTCSWQGPPLQPLGKKKKRDSSTKAICNMFMLSHKVLLLALKRSQEKMNRCPPYLPVVHVPPKFPLLDYIGVTEFTSLNNNDDVAMWWAIDQWAEKYCHYSIFIKNAMWHHGPWQQQQQHLLKKMSMSKTNNLIPSSKSFGNFL
jgi:hypothetical protein